MQSNKRKLAIGNTTMKLRVVCAVFCLAILCGLIASCNRSTQTKKDDDNKNADGAAKTGKESSPFEPANELFKYPNNPRSNDDWTRFRGGLAFLTDYFNKPDVVARIRLSDKDREFLQKEVHLNKSELSEVEATTFRPADAFYLDECYLLRDVAHHLEVTGSEPLEQARVDFAWVMRNVLLHQACDNWMPPAFSVRRGWGGALERSLVFLALLRQSQVEGCLIVVPETEPLQFLVAVHDSKSKSLRLFDPRLERPVLGKDGKSIATLQEAIETPDLLKPSMITPEQTKKLEAWMVCPLYALAPRMLELQKGLRAQDFITLYMAPEYVRSELAKVTTLPIKVWNPIDTSPDTAKGPERPPNSPTRCLRLFLPKSEGGLDETNRIRAYEETRNSYQGMLNQYAQIRLAPQLVPMPAYQLLIGISRDLLGKYDIQTRELYLRGKYEPMRRRQERVQDFANNDANANLIQDAEFQKERADWQKNINSVFAEVAAESDGPAKFLKMMQAQWSQDQYVGFLLEVDREDKLDRGFKKTLLTKILAVGLREFLQAELVRSRACAFHEIAADRQAALEALAKPSKSFEKRVNDIWFDAKAAWGNAFVDRIVLEQTIQQRLNYLQTRVAPNDLDTRMALLEMLHLEVQRYFQARMRLAETLAHTDGSKASIAALTKTKLEIESVEKAGLLSAEIKKLSASMNDQSRAFFQKRLQLLEDEWAVHGSYFWLKRQIDLRLDPPVT